MIGKTERLVTVEKYSGEKIAEQVAEVYLGVIKEKRCA